MQGIRVAVLADVPEIQRVGVEADSRYVDVGHPEVADGASIPLGVAERAVAEERLLVAEVDGRVVGWVYLERSSGELCLAQISVLTQFGRRGVGTALLERALDAARDAGVPTIMLNTQSDVPWGMPWYARHGFVVVPRDEWTADMVALAELQTEAGLDRSTRVHTNDPLSRSYPRTGPIADMRISAGSLRSGACRPSARGSRGSTSCRARARWPRRRGAGGP